MTDAGVSALVGGVGGAGTTRLALEFGATLARDGRSALVVDAAYATQGLSTVVSGRIDTDVTAVVTGDRPLEAATYGLDVEWDDEDPADPGAVAVAPARAPFERFSRAMTSACARRLASRLTTAAGEYDHVLVDVPPVAANPAVAAVTAADRVVVVVPDSQRGADALGRTRDRLADVDATVDAVVTNRTGGSPRVGEADAGVPESETTALPDAPAAVAPSEFATAVGDAVEATLTVELDLADPESGALTDFLG
jgi:septum site-determining protein MinD